LNPKGGGPKIARDSDGFFARALTEIKKETACYFWLLLLWEALVPVL